MVTARCAYTGSAAAIAPGAVIEPFPLCATLLEDPMVLDFLGNRRVVLVQLSGNTLERLMGVQAFLNLEPLFKIKMLLVCHADSSFFRLKSTEELLRLLCLSIITYRTIKFHPRLAGGGI